METEPGKLFIGGISWETSEERLRDYFQTFGEVVEAVIMKDRTTGRSRGFGFVVFADAFVAEKVVRERHVIDGRNVEAKKAVPREDHQNANRNHSNNNSRQGSPSPARTKKIFVGGLPSNITEPDFKRYFDQFGIITDVVVMYDHNTQRPRGFGFITYDTEESVDKVLFKTFHELNGKMVEVKRAVPKELSPGPRQTQSGGYNNYGINRVNSLLNAYGHNSLSPGGRNSPVTVDRNGYSPYGPNNYNMGLSLDSGLGLNYGASVESGLNYGNGMNSYFSASPSRFNSPVPNDLNNGGTAVSLLNATNNRTKWQNGSPNYNPNSINSNPFIGSVAGNIGEIWGLSSVTARNGGGNGSLNSENIAYDHQRGDKTVIRPIPLGNNGSNVGLASPFDLITNVRDRDGLGILHGNDSFYSNLHPWQSLPDELDIVPNNPAGFVGDYSVTAR